MDQHGENERLTVIEIIEVKQGFVLRMQEPPEFMQPVGPVVMEDVIQVNPHTLENLSMRLDRLVHLPEAALEDYRDCSRALYDQLFGSISAETMVKLTNLNTPLLISARNFETVWELLHDGEEFWGIKYPMARQIRTGVRPPLLPAREFPRGCLIIANPEGEEMLEVSERQAQGLVSHLTSLGIESVYLGRNRATPEQVLIELSSGNYDILHYTGHVVKLDEKNQPIIAEQPGEYAMLLAGGYLRQFEIENAARGIGVVFLNGCQSAGSIESLYLLVTDRYPYTFQDVDYFLAGKCWEQPMVPASKLNPLVGPQLDVILSRALALNHAERYSNAVELLASLEQWDPSLEDLPTDIDEKQEKPPPSDGETLIRQKLDEAKRLSMIPGRLNEAADMLEELLGSRPEIREQYQYYLTLWRRGIIM